MASCSLLPRIGRGLAKALVKVGSLPSAALREQLGQSDEILGGEGEGPSDAIDATELRLLLSGHRLVSSGVEFSLNVGMEIPWLAPGPNSRGAPGVRAVDPSLSIPSDLIRKGAAAVIQLGELMTILELHPGRVDNSDRAAHRP